MKHTMYCKKYIYRSNLLQLEVGGSDVPKKHATNTSGIEGLMPAELVIKIIVTAQMCDDNLDRCVD